MSVFASRLQTWRVPAERQDTCTVANCSPWKLLLRWGGHAQVADSCVASLLQNQIRMASQGVMQQASLLSRPAAASVPQAANSNG